MTNQFKCFIIKEQSVSFGTLLRGGGTINAILRNSFLFSSLCDADFSNALEMIEGETRSFLRGEQIYSPDAFERKIGFVISGECEVCRIKHDGGRVKLNTLSTGGSFGITAVFSENSFPTVVYAKRT